MKKFLTILALLPSLSFAFGGKSPPAPTPTPTPSPMKSAICGLVTMGSLNFMSTVGGVPDNTFKEANAHPGVYKAVVILATLAQLAPASGQFDFSVIDQALTNIQAYNAKYPTAPIVGKLRIFAGINSPAWVMALDNGPIALTDPTTGAVNNAPHYWSAPYRTMWQGLQTALATKYDANPLMGEVAVSECSSISAEPFNEALGTKAIPVFVAAGRTDALMHACLDGAVGDHSVWTHTPIDYTFNPARSVSGPVDNTFTVQVMTDHRNAFGARGVLANHGLQVGGSSAQSAIYTQLASAGAPVEFQTVSPSTDYGSVIPGAITTYHATEIELWDSKAAGGPSNQTLSQLQTWAALFTCK